MIRLSHLDWLSLEGAIAPFNLLGTAIAIINGQAIAGAGNRTEFATWLETCLIPVLRPGEGAL